MSYQDSYRYSVGGWILPNFNDFRSYFSRVIYRYGAYYETGNLKINGSSINKFAVTAGVTLPFQKSQINRMNSIDLGVELGKRGTLDNNLIRQNFINLKVGINFADNHPLNLCQLDPNIPILPWVCLTSPAVVRYSPWESVPA